LGTHGESALAHTDGQQPRRCTISGYPVNRVEVWSENSLVPYGPRVTENSVRVQVQYATVCGERGHSGISRSGYRAQTISYCSCKFDGALECLVMRSGRWFGELRENKHGQRVCRTWHTNRVKSGIPLQSITRFRAIR
jgi:hypothetical protein